MPPPEIQVLGEGVAAAKSKADLANAITASIVAASLDETRRRLDAAAAAAAAARGDFNASEGFENEEEMNKGKGFFYFK